MQISSWSIARPDWSTSITAFTSPSRPIATSAPPSCLLSAQKKAPLSFCHSRPICSFPPQPPKQQPLASDAGKSGNGTTLKKPPQPASGSITAPPFSKSPVHNWGTRRSLLWPFMRKTSPRMMDGESFSAAATPVFHRARATNTFPVISKSIWLRRMIRSQPPGRGLAGPS